MSKDEASQSGGEPAKMMVSEELGRFRRAERSRGRDMYSVRVLYC